jgi:hypothetical protein
VNKSCEWSALISVVLLHTTSLTGRKKVWFVCSTHTTSILDVTKSFSGSLLFLLTKNDVISNLQD